MTSVETNYANTDFDLRSSFAFDLLNSELSDSCCILHYAEVNDGTWSASYEADRLNDDASSDIMAIIDVMRSLSDAAKSQLAACTKRDFNIGLNCWDSWGYNLGLPPSLIAAIGLADCSISVTLYPMRHPDGTPKIDPDDG